MSMFQKNRILIFDECAFTGRLLYSILLAFEVEQIDICHDLEKAKEYIKDTKFDCIFCDWSGWPDPEPAFLEFVRMSDSSIDPMAPTIIITGQTTKKNVLKSRDLGCTEIIAKPVSTTQVFDKLYSALYSPRTFIEHEVYTGPDRRRRNAYDHAGVERRLETTLSQTEIDNLLESSDVDG